MADAETASSTGASFTYMGQYGVRRPSTRPDVYHTQFGSMTADEYLSPIMHGGQRHDGNVARRLSRNSFIIPPQMFIRSGPDGMFKNSF
jgi:hypothetical protein